MSHPDHASTVPARTRYIEPRISLMWLIGAVGGVMSMLAVAIWNVAIANANMVRLADSVGRLEMRIEKRETEYARLSMDIQANRAVNDVQNQRLTNLEESVRGVKAFVGVKP